MRIRTITGSIAGAAFALATVVSMAHADSGRVVYGTEKRDIIFTHNGGLTTVYALGGNDHVGGGRGTDIIYGGRGDDGLWTGSGGAKEAAYGGPGDDRINDWRSGESPGYLNGGPGHDVCVGDKQDTFVNCERIVFKK